MSPIRVKIYKLKDKVFPHMIIGALYKRVAVIK